MATALKGTDLFVATPQQAYSYVLNRDYNFSTLLGRVRSENGIPTLYWGYTAKQILADGKYMLEFDYNHAEKMPAPLLKGSRIIKANRDIFSYLPQILALKAKDVKKGSDYLTIDQNMRPEYNLFAGNFDGKTRIYSFPFSDGEADKCIPLLSKQI